jgi:DNA polymerase
MAARMAMVEWLDYLREIGVRDLAAPPIGPTEPTASSNPRQATRPPDTIRRRRPTAERAATVVPEEVVQTGMFAPTRQEGFSASGPSDPALRLHELRDEIGECTRCKLHKGRTHLVFGVGDPRARLMFIGEGPGADEDACGEPFVGRAGRKLNEMIAAIGLQRESVYIANVVKCRPPRNRDPERDEVETCYPFLEAQIAAIRPAVIVTLGAPATRTLLDTRVGITRLRGTWHAYRGIPVMPTFHPAYLLRAYTSDNRRKVWEDLKSARARMDESR